MAHSLEVEYARNVDIYTLLGSVSLSGHGEKYGPCVICGGNDRFHVKDNKWFCSHCTGRPGTGNGWNNPIDLAIALYNTDFRGAVAMLTSRAGPPPTSSPPPSAGPPPSPPSPEWQALAFNVVGDLADNLWRNPRARQWLAKRGIDENACARYSLGYTAGGDQGGLWFGLKQPERGITIPHWFQGDRTMFGLNIRRPVGLPKYYHVKGSKISQGLYNADSLVGNDICFVTEGELDAIALHSAIRERAAVVTLGAKGAAMASRWLPYISHVGRFIIVTDCNEDEAAANYWLDLVGDRGRRVTLPGGAKDICQAFENGLNLADWAIDVGGIRI